MENGLTQQNTCQAAQASSAEKGTSTLADSIHTRTRHPKREKVGLELMFDCFLQMAQPFKSGYRKSRMGLGGGIGSH